MNSLTLPLDINRLFPFYILIDSELKIKSIGDSLEKIFPQLQGQQFTDVFNIKRPASTLTHFHDAEKLIDQLIVIDSLREPKITLRGQFYMLDHKQGCLFMGTPWLESIDQVKALHLTLHDFALHDPMIDLLHVLKTHEITNNEIKELLKKVQEQQSRLKSSESTYRLIVENATDIIYKINTEGYFTYVNDVAVHKTGYSKEELLNMHYSQLIRKDFWKQAFELYKSQILNKYPTTYFEFPLVTKSGEETWLGQSVQFSIPDNEIPELTALALDINKRKQAEINLKLQEEKYRNIIANMNLGLFEVDLNHDIKYANQSFCNMSGYTLEELVGKNAVDLFISDDQKKLLIEKQKLREQGISDLYPISVLNKNKEQRWWLISGAPQYNDKGELIGSVGIHFDFTEQKKLEDELKVAKLKAEESSKAKENFLATMSHEIRTPLNAIIGISDLMHMDVKARNNENVDILRFSSKTLLALITDILDLSKIDAGKIELANNPIDIKALLQGIYKMFKSSCEEKKIELILDIDKSTPSLLLGDELRLSQILNNLVSNAVKFTDKGYVKIQVKAEKIGPENCKLHVHVIDSGIGIKEEKLYSIFNDFEQADTQIVRQYGGTGLGLSITKKLIELYGGEIHVDSTLHRGSTFSFSLSLKIAHANSSIQPNQVGLEKITQFNLEGKKVLLVEDNLINQKIAISYQVHWGMSYAIAHHGKEALDLLSQQSFDIALIDLFMPVMDGFETIQNIRKNEKLNTLPIIALTASAETSLMNEAVALGADSCVTKPFHPQHLYDRMLSLLQAKTVEKVQQNETPVTMLTNPEYKVINLDNLTEASLGSEKFLAEMLTILSQEIPSGLAAAETMIEQEDWMQVSKEIHKLKNSLLMLGIETLRSPLQFIEVHAKKSEKPDEVRTMFGQVKHVWEQAFAEVKMAQQSLTR